MQYYDKASSSYYYFHRETNTSQWEKPDIGVGVVLLGVAYGTGREYIVEEGEVVQVIEGNNNSNSTSDEPVKDEEDINDDDDTITMIEEHDQNVNKDTVSDFNSQEVMDHYTESYWRWNHPYRIPERTDVSMNKVSCHFHHRSLLFGLNCSEVDVSLYYLLLFHYISGLGWN